MKYLVFSLLLASTVFGQQIDYKQQVKNKPVITITDAPYSAIADGVTDQRAKIQQAVDALNTQGGGKLIFPAASLPFMFNTGIKLYSNITVQLEGGSTFKRVNSYNSSCGGGQSIGCVAAFFTLANTRPSNIHIIGQGTIDGNRANNAGVGEGGGNCVTAIGWSTSSIEGIRCINSPADGIWIIPAGTSSTTYNSSFTLNGDYFTIDGAYVSNATRNGLTLEGGLHTSIINSTFTGTNGVAPQAGIDVEPSLAGQLVTGLTTRNIHVTNNAGNYGFAILLNYTSEPEAAFDLDCDCSSNTLQGLTIALPTAAASILLKGINITGRYMDNAGNGLVLDNEETIGNMANITVSALSIGSPNAMGCSRVDNLTLGPGFLSGSSDDFGSNNCTNVKFNGTTLAHNNNAGVTAGRPTDPMQEMVKGVTSTNVILGCIPSWVPLNNYGTWKCPDSTATGRIRYGTTYIRLDGPLATSSASGALDMIAIDPSFRMRNTGTLSIADQRTFDTRIVSNSSAPIAYYQWRLINDATTVSTHLMALWASGGLSLDSSGLTDPGAGNFTASGKVKGTLGLISTPTTVASLPNATLNAGMIRTVTDSSVITWGSNVAAGGANIVSVISNGSSWTVIGK
jgi:hypothetical protein